VKSLGMTKTLEDRIGEYQAWKAHWDADRPLADEHDPYRCAACSAAMLRSPWRCPTCGGAEVVYTAQPYTSNLNRALAAEEDEWQSDRDWTDLLDDLIAARSATPEKRGIVSAGLHDTERERGNYWRRRGLEAEARATELRDALAAIAYSSVRRDGGVQMRDIALAALEQDEKKGNHAD
jgi:hypothetical protein